MGSTRSFDLQFSSKGNSPAGNDGAGALTATPAPSSTGGGGGGGPGPLIASYNTMATMKAQASAAAAWLDGSVILLSGFQARDDGGGGLFEWVAASALADDGGCIIQITGITTGRLIRVIAGIRCTTTQRNSPTLNVWWYGAIPGATPGDCTPGITAAFNAIANGVTFKNGTVYIPAGLYACYTPISLTSAQAVTVKGDGPGSLLVNYISTQQTAFMTVEFTNGGALLDFGIGTTGAGVDHLSGLWIESCSYLTARNLTLQINSVGGMTGGILRLTANTSLRMSDCLVIGAGMALYHESGSGTIGGSWFSNSQTTGTVPAFHWAGSDSLQISNCFFAGGGPWAAFSGCAVTSTVAHFTVAAAGHAFLAGDYVLLRGATNAGYNGWWQIASVVAGTSVTITSAANLGNDTVILSSLWSCIYLSGINSATESFIQDCTCNTGGIPSYPGPSAGNMPGTVGFFLDGYGSAGRTIGQITARNIFCDYGYCTIFAHGVASGSGSTCETLTFANCRPNGGPRDTFGCIRLEGVNAVAVSNSMMFPVLNGISGSPNFGSGLTFYSYVITDGGQAANTQDISITGGIASNQDSSSLNTSCTAIYAFTIAGANVHNVQIANVGVDVTNGFAHCLQLLSTGTGAAVCSNGITCLFNNNAGRLNLIDSTRNPPSGSSL